MSVGGVKRRAFAVRMPFTETDVTTTTTKAILASSLAIALAACGSEAEEPAQNPAADAQANAEAEYDPMTRDYALNETAAERRASFDDAAFGTEYAAYREEIIAERVAEAGEATDDMDDDDRAEMTAASSARDAGTTMRARKDMTWPYLDRNDDNRLSVAEYAIWAIPLDPNAPAANDSDEPQLTADQINKAADSFFYYDLDGDTYLSRREFTSARRGDSFDN